MHVRGILKERLFRAAAIGALAVLGLFFGGLLVSLMGSTSPGRFWKLLWSRDILFAIRLSVLTATISTLAAVLIALPAAYALSRLSFRGKGVVDTLLDLPIVISPIALGAALMVFSNTRLGGFIDRSVIGYVFEVPGLVIAQFAVVAALATRLLKSTFDLIDPRYERVGRVLGCTRLRAFTRVSLPLARPGIIAAVVLTWARAIGEFGASVTLAGATSMKTATLPIAIGLKFEDARVEDAVAIIFVLVIIASSALLAVRWVGGRRGRA